MKLEKIGSLGMEEEEVPEDYEPICQHLGEYVFYVLKDVKMRNIAGFNNVTSYLLDRIETLEKNQNELLNIINKLLNIKEKKNNGS